MDISDLNFETDFVTAFCQFSGTVYGCECGTTHVAMASDNSFDWERGEYESWRVIGEEDENVTLHYDRDGFKIIHIDKTDYVYGCECEGWREYFNIMVAERQSLRSFIRYSDFTIRQAKEKQKVFDILGSTYVDKHRF